MYHVLNRAVGRATLFESSGDDEAFVRVLTEAADRVPMRLLAWCLMPNHWHLVVWPRRDGDLSDYVPLAHGDAHPALARGSRHVRHGSALSGAV